MTLFQLFNTLFQNEIIKKDIYLDRLKELKASKEKELEEIIKAMESVQHLYCTKKRLQLYKKFLHGVLMSIRLYT